MIYAYVQILFILLPQNHMGEVSSSAYQLMLDTLLKHSVPEISVAELNEDNQIVWLDARKKEEYEVSKIPEARWVGYEDISLDRLAGVPKNANIIVYCSVGYRSEKVSEILVDSGYSHVSNLFGGIFEWKNQGRKVVDTVNFETDKVHGYSKLWSIWLNKGEIVY